MPLRSNSAGQPVAGFSALSAAGGISVWVCISRAATCHSKQSGAHQSQSQPMRPFWSPSKRIRTCSTKMGLVVVAGPDNRSGQCRSTGDLSCAPELHLFTGIGAYSFKLPRGVSPPCALESSDHFSFLVVKEMDLQ